MQQIRDIIETQKTGSVNGNGSTTLLFEGKTVEEWVKMSNKILLQCYSIIRNIENLSSGHAFEEICKIILVKALKDEEHEGELNFLCEKGIRDKDELKQLFEATKRKQNYTIFNTDDEIRIKSQTCMEVLRILDNFRPDVFKYIKGAFFEEFLNITFKNKLFEMWTPSSIVDYMVEILSPKNGEWVGDPCCGNGSFLIKSDEYIKKVKNNSIIKLCGTDTDEFAIKTAKLNMFMHDIENYSLYEHDGLLNIEEISENKFDVILAHPAFALKYYDTGSINGIYYSIDYKRSDMLFIERGLNLLKPGGRMGIILIDNILDSRTFEKMRHYIESKARIIKITSLPINAFAPFTSAKTSIIFFQKYTLEEKGKYEFIYKNKKNGIKNNLDSNLYINYNFVYADIKDIGNTSRGYNADNNQLLLLAKEYRRALKNDSIGNLTLLKQANYAQLTNWSVSFLKNNVIEKNDNYSYRKIGNFMTKNVKFIKIKDKEKYKRVTVRLYDNGVELRDEVEGEEIGTKRQIRVSKGQFIISKIGASSGAVGIVPDELDNAIVTQDFLTYNIDTNLVLPEYLGLLLSTKHFMEYLEDLNTGSVIKRLNEDLFLNIEIPLPSLVEQNELCQKIIATKKTLKQLANELESEKQKLENTLFNN